MWCHEEVLSGNGSNICLLFHFSSVISLKFYWELKIFAELNLMFVALNFTDK